MWEAFLDGSVYFLLRWPDRGELVLRYFDILNGGEITCCELMLECDPSK